ncbi:AAA family ATPase [Roseofilum casamattae]|uniref:Nuclease SbcCD subunit C n=1 Tax=Roseofilum casamattae BLCC-M143 TaxID=3022442 RepID=A0ABT7BT47_9CYAN|nr:AAA family ATPase [Roseofilum casamattae]MDJ1182351.1 AAA family ATPase [Roseofilum casamattae BLCC-M143]
MIPLHLVLQNFLSYQQGSLDFRALHTACISGVNGAGKSSLLEAIAWCVWGKSRVSSEDDLIHRGAGEVRVIYILRQGQQTFRIIRTRQRGQSTSLEFQVESETGFRPLTGRHTRDTQQLIIRTLKLDYQTFVNSAYLRQGRGDEFMLKGAMERKQILARLLQLDRYDELADRAKEKTQHYKAMVSVLEPQLQGLQRQLSEGDAIASELQQVEKELHQLQEGQTRGKQQLSSWQTLHHQQQTLQEQLKWYEQESQSCDRDRKRVQQEMEMTVAQRSQLQHLLADEGNIASQYRQFQQLRSREASLTERVETYQQLQEELARLRNARQEQQQVLEDRLRLSAVQLENIAEQQQEIDRILSRRSDIEAGLVKLGQARDRLNALDRLQLQVAPLLRHRQHLQAEIDRGSARLSAKLEELQTSYQRLEQERSETPILQRAAEDLAGEIDRLEKKRIYQQRVLEKGQERRSFMERLQGDQRTYERQLDAIGQKLQLLQQRSPNENEETEETSEYPPCPLCDRPLDEHHWHLVRQKHTSEQQEILNSIWVLREQMATSEREIQVLRQEYRDLDRELAKLSPAIERRGELRAVLDVTEQKLQQLHQLQTEISEVEHCLQTRSYAADVYAELQGVDERLAYLQYDEKDHVLARGAVEKWRWADIKRGEIKSALKRQKALHEQKPELEAECEQLHHRLQQLQSTCSLQRQIAALEAKLAELGYDPQAHQELLSTIGQSHSIQIQYEQLEQAKQHYPQLINACTALEQRLEEQDSRSQQLQEKLKELDRLFAQHPDAAPQIKTLQAQLDRGEQQQRELLSRQGRLQQQQQHVRSMASQCETTKTQLEQARKQQRIYQELAYAFGKRGIQSLAIENILPELEAQTNRILAKLSSHQLHVQFVTQKAKKSGKGKFVETLDILIADPQGTRPYETYSGGEAFRVNFAIRLALAKLLAQQSGTALQMLIIDEGFGTQDEQGCDRLISAINAISSEFACILTITHMSFFKEAFSTRIEVIKTANGSQLSIQT